MTAQTTSRLASPAYGYQSHIDGLRSVAVTAVLLFHCGFGFAKHGFLGVDIFFVISGYLITGLLINELGRTGTISFPTFYLRRARRLLPNLFAMLFATTLVAPLLMNAEELRQLGKSVIATAIYVSNVYFYRQTGYFTPAAEEFPLLHTWSLAVEEQFYFVWPLLVIACFVLVRRWRWCRPVWIIGFAGVASLIGFVVLNHVSSEAAFYLTPARVWQFAFGAVLALLRAAASPRTLSTLNPTRHRALVYVATATLLWVLARGAGAMYATITEPIIVVAITTILLALCGAASTDLVSRALRSPLANYLGRTSYSLYLWHWPVVVFYRFGSPGPIHVFDRIACLALSIALGLAAYHLIENPIRLATRLPMLGRPKAALAGFGAASAVLVGIGALHWRFAPTTFSPAAEQIFVAATRDVNPLRTRCLVMPGSEALPSSRECTLGTSRAGTPLIIVWGDSHADAMLPGFASAMDGTMNILEIAKSGCPPMVGLTIQLNGAPAYECGQFNRNAMTAIHRAVLMRPALVILAARWAYYLVGDPKTGEQTANNADDIRNALHDTLRQLEAIGASTLIVGPVPEFTYDVPRCLARAANLNKQVSLCNSRAPRMLDRIQYTMRLLEGAVNEVPRAALVRPDQWLCSAEVCNASFGIGRVLYSDSDHLSIFGARFLANRIFSQPNVSSLYDAILHSGAHNVMP